MHAFVSDRPVSAAARASKILRWTFRRRSDFFICELGLDRDDAAYELTTRSQHDNAARVEVFSDAIIAFQRQAALERSLVADGWSLERFHVDTITEPRR